MARGRVSLSGGFSPRFFMEFCSRGGGVRSAQRCPDRLEGVRALGRGTGAQAGPCRGRTFRSRRGGRGRRLGPARSFGGLGAVSGGAGASGGILTDGRPQAEHGGRISLHLWNGRRRERRGAYGKERSLTCLGCRTEGHLGRAMDSASRATKNSARRA